MECGWYGKGDENDLSIPAIECVDAMALARVKVGGVAGFQRVVVSADRELYSSQGDKEPFLSLVAIGFITGAVCRNDDGNGMNVKWLGGAGKGSKGQSIGLLLRGAATAHDHAIRGVIGMLEECGDRNAKGAGDLAQSSEGRLARAGFQAAEIGLGKAGFFGQRFQRPV